MAMRVVALLMVRNEERILRRCLQELYNEGVEVCLIDNESTDNTLKIAESFKNKNVFRIEHIPYYGAFELMPILQRMEQLYNEIDADWFIEHDADEIRQSPFPGYTLNEAIAYVDKQGYNAINFDEFVFIPTRNNPVHSGKDFVETMRYYYFYEPYPLRMVKAFKKTNEKIDLVSSGGHRVTFNHQLIYPYSFVLRHYITLSKPNAIAKYCDRVFSEKEIKNYNWHSQRNVIRPENIVFPDESALKEINDTKFPVWDKSDPWKQHFFVPQTNKSIFTSFQKKISNKVNLLINKDKKVISSTKKTNNNLPLPIIIGGCYRSGTTLLRRIIDSHSNISCPPEIKFFKDFYGDYLDDPLQHARLFSTLKTTGLASEEILSTFGEAFIKAHTLIAKKKGKKRWADKNPENVLHLHDWETLLNGKFLFILLVRNPLDTIASIKEIGFKKTIPPGLKERVEIYNRFTTAGLKYASQHPDKSLILQYEHLVSKPELSVQNIINFVGENYEKSMLESFNSHKRNQGIEDPKISSTKTVHTNSVERWKNDLTTEEATYIRKKCSNIMKHFNYNE